MLLDGAKLGLAGLAPGVLVSTVPVELALLSVVGVAGLVPILEVAVEGMRLCPAGVGVPTKDIRLTGGGPMEPSTEARAVLLAVEGVLVLVRMLLPSVDALMVVLGVSGAFGVALDETLKLDGAAAAVSFRDMPPSERREDGRETVPGVLKTEDSRR